MSKNERSHNGRSTVRVLHFPESTPTPPTTGLDADALADSIRKAWTQKSSPAKRESGGPRLLRMADNKI
jgi:hypothetical protein